MQTSIEWLIEQYNKYRPGQMPNTQFKEVCEQAKEMHKQEIIDAHNSGFEKSAEGWNGEYGLMDMNNISEEIGSEQYYNGIFKKD